jgi:hypothetical protein
MKCWIVHSTAVPRLTTGVAHKVIRGRDRRHLKRYLKLFIDSLIDDLLILLKYSSIKVMIVIDLTCMRMSKPGARIIRRWAAMVDTV